VTLNQHFGLRRRALVDDEKERTLSVTSLIVGLWMYSVGSNTGFSFFFFLFLFLLRVLSTASYSFFFISLLRYVSPMRFSHGLGAFLSLTFLFVRSLPQTDSRI
jgi:hypothetical protein